MIDLIQKELNSEKSYTQNGALAFATSGKQLLDFNFSVSALRHADKSEIWEGFSKAFYEAPNLAVAYMFYAGDIRGGLGERRVFEECFKWLTHVRPELCCDLLRLIPEYSRWDLVVNMAVNRGDVEESVQKEAVKYIKEEIDRNLNGQSSYLAKWLPSTNVSKKTRVKALKLAKMLGYSEPQYRRLVSSLRKNLNIVETKMCENKWDAIIYEQVPSVAGLRYKNAFFRHDEDGYYKYLQAVNRGEKKINAGVLFPHEIITKYAETRPRYHDSMQYDEALETMWKNLPDNYLKNTLVVRDGSGSMCWSCSRVCPLHVATALAIYCAEHNSGPWKNKYITFSAKPEFVDLSNCNSLLDKITHSFSFNDCSNTDMYKTMRLVLDTAVHNHLTQDELPEQILIVSDMQFDEAIYDNRFYYSDHPETKTLFEKIQNEFEAAGYKLPKLVFWNVAGFNFNTIPVQENECGLALVSGYSVNILEMVMSGGLDPYEILIKTVYGMRYEPVLKIISEHDVGGDYIACPA